MNPTRITSMATGYWASMALLGLNELGVFSALGGQARSAEALAEELGCDLRALRLLLNAGVSLDLLLRSEQGYRNGPEAAAFLAPGGPAFLGSAIRYAYDVYPAWGQLVAGVRSGRAQVQEASYLGEDNERTERFVRAMHGRALGFARGVAGALDLGEHARLLDVAGGSGAYSMLLCQRYPKLRATVCDLPGILAVSQLLLGEAGLNDRIATHAWDLRDGQLPRGHDVALVSGILHRLEPSACRRLLSEVFAVLEPGGAVILADVMLDASAAGPTAATLFGLNMLLTAEGGGAHRIVDHEEWLLAVGFTALGVVELGPGALHTVVTGRKAP